MKILFLFILIFLLPISSFALDADNDGSEAAEETLAGTSDNNPNERPYWWRTLSGENTHDRFGTFVSGVGDVNNDGYADFSIGSYTIGSEEIESVKVFSGSDASALYTFYGDSVDIGFGTKASGAGDVNNDGYDDIIVGAFLADVNGVNSGSAWVYSGIDGSELYRFNGGSAQDKFGSSVSGAGDVNNDGYDDVIIGASGHDGNRGMMRTYSGLNGSIIRTKYGDDWGDLFGASVSSLGDVNQDGYDEVIVGALWHGNHDYGTADIGQVKVFSGYNGIPLYTLYGDEAGSAFGRSVSGAGDLNNDGYPDFVVGMDQYNYGRGRVKTFSGKDGSVMHTFDGDNAAHYFGFSVSGSGDIDGDGYDDLVIGTLWTTNSNAGSVHVFSGLDGESLYTFYGENYSFFGNSVDIAGDIDNDGYDDIIIGAYRADINGVDSGSARIILSSDLMNDVDLDFLVNSADPDDDNDGALDGNDAFPLDASETADTDADGVGDNTDIQPLNPNIQTGNEIFLLDKAYEGISINHQSQTQ